MIEGEEHPGTERVDAHELGLRLGVEAARVEHLADLGVLDRDADGRYDPGDVHRVRLLRAFEDAGVPLEALIAASDAGTISLRYYDQLHPAPTAISPRTYAAFAADLPAAAREELGRLFAAFGLAEPLADTRLAIDDEKLIAELLDIAVSTGHPDLALRAVRLFGEGARRAADGALGVYGEAVARSNLPLAGLPIDEQFDELLWPWARFARQSARLAGWLASRHLTRAIDEYSVDQTEQILEAAGFVPARPDDPPAIAFVDLTGFTRLTEEQGDEAAAAIALRLGEVAATTVAARAGRLVKLLGDGVLLRFDDTTAALDAVLDVLDALPGAGLPSGHAGIASGSLIVRDNDVFGRTVNLAARIADVAPDGRLYAAREAMTSLPAAAIDGRFRATNVDAAVLQGIGRVELVEVVRV